MELTKEQKLQCYKGALEDIIKADSCLGICECMDWRLCEVGIDTIVLLYEEKIKFFPELISYKPEKKEAYQYWFKDNEERIEVLTQIITDLENDNN